MTFEQRIEELENEVSSLKKVVTNMIGGDFSVKGGEIFISNAYIQPGSINAAISQAAIESNASAIIENAEANVSQRTIRVGVNCSQELNDGINTDKRITEFEQQVSELKKQITSIQEAVICYQDLNQLNFNELRSAIHCLQQVAQ